MVQQKMVFFYKKIKKCKKTKINLHITKKRGAYMKKQTLVNIYHFIRKSTYPDGVFTQEDFDTLKNEMLLLKQHQLPATYALKHDALIDERYIELIQSTVDEKDEVGAWWEITKEMANRADVVWKGKDVIDLHVKAGYSLAYSPDERKRLIDVYMKDFKEIYGDYPKTIGSWVIDIVTLTYAKEKYGVIGGALCRDQKGIDGFTLWGGYVNGAYYPSKRNEYIPAQNTEMQLDLPVFKLLGPDPIYNLEAEARKEAAGIYTLEPAWTCGQSKEWVKWLFECITEEEQIGYGYTQAGQENSFIWGNVGDGFEMQTRLIARLRKEGKIRVESLRDSAIWFKKKYKLTPPITYTASKDWHTTFDLKTCWYSSRFYRSSWLLEEGRLTLRDLFLYDENYASRYLDTFIDNNESVFDALPIIDASRGKVSGERECIECIDLTTNKSFCSEVIGFEALEDDQTWRVKWKISDENELVITHTQTAIHFSLEGQNAHKIGWGIRINKVHQSMEIKTNEIRCNHEGFAYGMKVEDAVVEADKEYIVLKPQTTACTLVMTQNQKQQDASFFQEAYLRAPYIIDEQAVGRVAIDQEKMVKIPLIKPVLSHKAYVKKYDEEVICVMENINECGKIHYTLDGSEPIEASPCYSKPLIIKDTCVVKAKVLQEGRVSSACAQAKYFNTLPVENITSETIFDERKVFNRKGVLDLIDGQKGSLNYVDNCWLITTNKLDVVLDLGKERVIEKATIGFMQSKRSGPCYPEYVTFYVSNDGKVFEEVTTVWVHGESGDPDIEIKDVSAMVNQNARYIKIIAKPYKHYFIFTDEIIVEGY